VAKILLVEDTIEIQRLYSEVLHKKGHIVVVAGSVMQAMMSIGDTEFDYVFVDIKLPDFDGFELLREAEFADRHPNTKVVVLTNSESTRDYDRAKELGVDNYLVKIDYSPYGLAQMIADGEL